MIRFLSRLSHLNTLRHAQYSAVRLCSSKSDDSSIPVLEPIEDEPEDSSEPATFIPEKSVDSKYSRSDKNASLVELFNSLPSDPKNVSLQALVEFYDRIKGNYLITNDMKKHPKFAVFREATEILSPQLNTKELKNVFIAVIPSKPVMFDKLGNIIVDALLKRVSYIPFDQIMFVDFILNKYYNVTELSKNYNILRLTLQTMFLSKVEDELAEMKEFEEIMKIVAYCENNSEIIPSKIVNSLTTSLLLVDEDKFTVMDLTSVVIFLSNLGKLNEHVEKLFHKVIGLWYQSPVTANEVQVLLKVLAAKSHTIDKEIFKDSEFIRHCIKIVTQQNEKKISFSVQNSFNRIGFVSVDLIEHLSKFFEIKDDMRDLTVVDYIIICTACVKADYKPANWNKTIIEALKTFKFSIYLTSFGNFDWAQFALYLEKLGYCDTRLIRNILNSKHLQKQKSYDPVKLDKLTEILEREDVSSSESSNDSDDESSSSDDTDGEPPLYDDLKGMFGIDKIWPNVRIDSKSTIPYLLKMDLKSGDFLPFTQAPSVRRKENNELLIGVIVIEDESGKWEDRNKMRYAKKQSRHLERRGISSIILEESKWSTLKNYEKSLVFYTKIVNLMEFYRKKKLNQLGKDY
ncbi:uncharacterized protein LOC129574689 [Sitodiplosis mosellana]|uniref:uncharacterized protein LOC129574689 n=1 Tax=Sitodiplosis mosellana TaxID=263140 RepID=UPI002444571D|nr:uncharacterized protein LOC129574689 [Sitodiplosis mosellana]